jgi:hypothetical protein
VLRQYWTARATVDALLRGHQLGATTDVAGSTPLGATDANTSLGGH